ncbi:MAG: sulfite exporter TauE/SafE family protein [Bacteroidota bacterium]
MFLWTAFLLGLGGSLHCVSMCGPVVMALPLTARERKSVVLQALLYHLGRVSTYALMGLFFGLMGWGIALSGYQNLFSILLGVALLGSAIFSISLEQQLLKQPYYRSFIQKVKTRLSRALSIDSSSSAFGIGALNGLLPCGLVYVALAGSISTSSAWAGAAYMALFGLGTLPLLFALMLASYRPQRWLARFRQAIPYGLAIFGIFLIYRGFLLDIPVELRFWESTNFQPMCH